MTIAESRSYIEQRMRWHIHEETFEVIDEERCCWIAEVLTTHLQENETFFVLVQYTSYFLIDPSWRHKLAAWVAKHL